MELTERNTETMDTTAGAKPKAKPKKPGSNAQTNGHAEPSADLDLLLTALQTMRNGDFSGRLPGTWRGMAGKIADTFNEIAAANQQMAQELKRLGRLVGKQGKTKERACFDVLRGEWGQMELYVNALVEDLLRPTTEVTRAIAAVAQGDLAETVRLDVGGRPLEGEFLRSAKIVNTMIQQLSMLTEEVTRVACEVGTEGKLGGQALVPGVAGTWRDLTDSVNSMASNLTGQVRKSRQLELLNEELRNLSSRLITLQDEERRRVARELHDGLGQELSAAKMMIDGIRSDPSPESKDRTAHQASQLLDQVIQQVRSISHLLHPPLLDEIGLSSALRWYVDGLAKRSGIQTSLDFQPADFPRLVPEMETAVFRIIQEALTNIFRHSEARQASVSIGKKGPQVIIAVRDDGKGISDRIAEFRPGSLGIGIGGMRQRAKEFGGELRLLKLTPGTLVEVVLPLKSASVDPGVAQESPEGYSAAAQGLAH